MHLRASRIQIVLLAVALAAGAVIFAIHYRARRAPAVVVEKMLPRWKPGYHKASYIYWAAENQEQPLYHVFDFEILETVIKDQTAKVVAKIRYATQLGNRRKSTFTFLLKKNEGSWKIWHYNEGFEEQIRRRSFDQLLDSDNKEKQLP